MVAPDEGHEVEDDGGHVSAALLSHAKDVRYIQQCQQLLFQILENVVPRTMDPESVTHLSWYVSCLLYNYFVLSASKQTLGMAATGLEFSAPTSGIVSTLTAFCATAIYGGTRWLARQKSTDASRNLSSGSQEGLRGEARRRQFQRLRQQMIQRRNESEGVAVHNSAQASSSNTNVSVWNKIGRIVVKLLVEGFIPDTTPHDVRNGPNAGTNNNMTMAKWILRLHLAHFCITGSPFPTWIHRLCGLRINKTTEQRQFSSPLPRLVGGVICFQAFATVIRVCSNHLSKWLVTKSEAMLQDPETVEDSQPALKVNVSEQSNDLATCAICRTTRSNSAAPVSCGHVMCWNCLLQWISTVRPECPICRSPCRPQDVIALHNYSPTPTNPH